MEEQVVEFLETRRDDLLREQANYAAIDEASLRDSNEREEYRRDVDRINSELRKTEAELEQVNEAIENKRKANEAIAQVDLTINSLLGEQEQYKKEYEELTANKFYAEKPQQIVELEADLARIQDELDRLGRRREELLSVVNNTDKLLQDFIDRYDIINIMQKRKKDNNTKNIPTEDDREDNKTGTPQNRTTIPLEENEYSDLSDEELLQKIADLDAEFDEEYQFRAHEENGMEEHGDNFIDEYNRKRKGMQDELDRRKGKGTRGGVLGSEPESEKLNLGYEDMLDMYKDDLEKLYDLHKKLDRDEIPYDEYAKFADYMVERYKFMMNEYEKEKAKYGESSHDPFEEYSDEELQKLRNKVEEELNDEYNFRAHMENGTEEHDDKKIAELEQRLKDIEEKLKRRKEKPYRNMTDEELQQELKDLENEFNDEYQFRTHEENGMEEHPDDFMDQYNKKKKQIEDEIARRQNKNVQKVEKPEEPTLAGEKEQEDPPPRNLPAVGFWQIVNKTNTEPSGRFANYMYRLSKLKTISNLLPGKEGYSLDNLLGIVTMPLTIPLKLAGVVSNGIAKTGKKYETTQRQVDELTDEEFGVVLDRLLHPKEAIKYKMNDLFMDAIYTRARRMLGEKKLGNKFTRSVAQEEINTKLDRIAKLEEEAKHRELTTAELDEVTRLNSDIGFLTQEKNNLEKENTQMADLEILLRDSKELKTGRYKNIGGWLFAKTNPNNLEQNAKMEEFERARLDSEAKGDNISVARIDNAENEYVKSQTKVRKIFGKIPFIKTFKVSTGAYQHEEAEFVASNEEERTTQKLIALAIAGISIPNIINSVKNMLGRKAEQRAIDQQISQHNSDVQQVNANNAQVQQNINNANANNAQVQQNINNANANNAQVQQNINNANANNAQVQQEINAANANNAQVQQEINNVNGQITRANQASVTAQQSASTMKQTASQIQGNQPQVEQAIKDQITGQSATKHAVEEISIHDKGSWTNYTQQQLAEDTAHHVSGYNMHQQNMTDMANAQDFDQLTDVWVQSGKETAKIATDGVQISGPYAAANPQWVYGHYMEGLDGLSKAGTSADTLSAQLKLAKELAEQVSKYTKQTTGTTIPNINGVVQNVNGTIQNVSGTIQIVEGTIQTVNGVIQNAPMMSGITLGSISSNLFRDIGIFTLNAARATRDQVEADRRKTDEIRPTNRMNNKGGR